MNLTDHTDLGLRALVLLAASEPERLSAQDIARRHAVSYAHVQKVVQSLQAAGFVDTFRGRGGGVQLARAPEDIRIGDVVRALEPHLDFVECFREGKARCLLTGGCALTATLRRARDAMLAELDRTTLAEILRGSPAVYRLRSA